MQTDEQFAESLRQRAEAAAPNICVHTERVVPRARRRRVAMRAIGTGLAVTVVATGGWVLDARPWSVAVPPPASLSVPPAMESTPQVPATTDDGLGSGTHWYTLTRTVGPDGEQRSESWLSLTEPGLLLSEGDLSTAMGVGPRNVIGSFRVDGQQMEQIQDPNQLLTSSDSLEVVLRASVEPDSRSGTDDDKVFGMARDLLAQGGLLPPTLRAAAWAVAGDLPAAAVTQGLDTTGRPGEVLEYPQDGQVHRLVLDPVTALILEEGDGGMVTTYLEQGPTSDLPLEPTLESSGCASWDTC